MTAAEVELYRALKEMAGDRYVVLAKVALNEIFLVVRPNENVHYFSKLFRKYVDFLLCIPETLMPRIGVELIRSGPDKTMREADRFMADLFLSAGLPLVQLRFGEQLAAPELISRFEQAVAEVQQGGARADSAADSVPLCPVCGKMMVLRTQRGGKADGRLYYGCIDNPTCPGRVALKPS